MKTLISLSLVIALALIPFAAQAQSQGSPPPDKSRIVGGIVLGILVIAVGTLVITGLKKMCKKLPPVGSITNAPPEDITRKYPSLQSPTNIESSMVSLEEFDGVSWQDTLTVRFDDEANAVVTRNGEVVLTNVPCYMVPSSNGEYLIYYDLRQVWIERKAFAFFRLMSQQCGMAMPAATSRFIVQFTGDDGIWIDVDESPVKLTAESLFRDYRKKIPKTRNVRLIRRTEEVLGIRI